MLWRRHLQILDQLQCAQRMVGKLLERVRELEAERPPAVVQHAMGVRGSQMRAVAVDIDSAEHVIVLPPEGIPDDEAAEVWRRLRERYGRPQ